MKKNQTRRLANDGRYLAMFEWFMRSAAWQHASVYEKALYVEIKRRYDGKNNGDIPMSHREAAGLLSCSNKPIAAAFTGLQQKGFIKASTKGSFDWKVAREGKNFGRSTRWELTELPRDLPVRVLSGGSKEFMNWRPGENLAVCPEHTNGTPTADHERPMVRPGHTITSGVYANGIR